MKEFIIICLIILSVGVAGHLGGDVRDKQNLKEFQVWTKVTGNPNGLTLEEYIIYKGIK